MSRTGAGPDMAISPSCSRGPMDGARGPTDPPVVVSIGGSVLVRGDNDARYISDLAELLRQLGRSTPMVVTTGGGRMAREYIRLGTDLGLTSVELDELAIDVTRLHARLLAGRIGLPTASHPPLTIREAVEAVRHSSPVVLGGTEPGHTTDAVAALVAVRLRAARVVNATDVDGLYDADPRTHANARRLSTVGWPELLDLLHRASAGEPGQNFPFDRLGAETLARAAIPMAIVAGRDLVNLTRALRGEPFTGTAVGGQGGERP